MPAAISRSLRETFAPDGWRVLLLAPHPDDFDAVAVTMKFLVEHGARLEVAVAPTGSGIEDAYLPGATLADKSALRQREQRASLCLFGLPEERLRFLSMANDAEDQVADHPANRTQIAALLRELTPDAIFLPHGHDHNPAHRAMAAMLQAAITDNPARATVIFFNRDPKTIAMRGDLHLPFGHAEAEWKRALLRCHDSQQQRNLNTRGHGFDDRILDFNARIAANLAITQPYAEEFDIEFHRPSPAASPRSGWRWPPADH